MMTERNTDPNGENDVEGHLFPHKATEDAPAPGAEPEVAEHGAKGGATPQDQPSDELSI